MKKAQLLGLPLVYIFVAILAALLLIFGFKAIKDLSNIADRTQIQKELKSLESDVKRVFYLSKGSQEELSYHFPSKATEVCFKVKDSGNSPTPTQPTATQEDIIDGLADNVFLFQGNKLIGKITVNELITEGDALKFCKSLTNGNLNLILENKGNYVSII